MLFLPLSYLLLGSFSSGLFMADVISADPLTEETAQEILNKLNEVITLLNGFSSQFSDVVTALSYIVIVLIIIGVFKLIIYLFNII